MKHLLYAVVCATVAIAMALEGCSRVAHEDTKAGLQATTATDRMIQYGCPTCHVIRGVPGAVGKVGPSLVSLPQRSYLAGRLPNSTDNLQRWLMHPQSIEPGVAMPEMGISAEDAHQIALYLEATQ